VRSEVLNQKPSVVNVDEREFQNVLWWLIWQDLFCINAAVVQNLFREGQMDINVQDPFLK
jgi:hypothetical protein